MKNFNQHIDVIIKSLSGDAAPNEKKELFDSVKKDPALEKEYKELKKTWDLTSSKPDKELSLINVDEEWSLFDAKISQTQAKLIPLNKAKSRKSFYKIASAIAAVFILSFGVFYWLNLKPNELVAHNSILESNLPDGSVVSLNTGSKLDYALGFNKKKRIVKLKGEAFFKVAHNSEKPFIVKTGRLNIEVVGTEFNVNAKNLKGNVEVIVSSGKVLVYSKKDKSDAELLQAGDKAKFIMKKAKIVKQANENPNFLSWKTKKINFEDTKLTEVVKTLNHTYNTQITIKNPKLYNCTLTLKVDNQNLNSVLKVIEATMDVHISKHGNRYEINGSACEK